MNATLLIADGDGQNRDTLQRSFSQSGFKVETAADGLECLAKLYAIQPDVLVIELDMPWGGGDGVIARLNDGMMLSKMPAVLVLGVAPVEALAARAGMPRGHCYQKPFELSRLMDSVCQAIAWAEDRRAGHSG